VFVMGARHVGKKLPVEANRAPLGKKRSTIICEPMRAEKPLQHISV